MATATIKRIPALHFREDLYNTSFRSVQDHSGIDNYSLLVLLATMAELAEFPRWNNATEFPAPVELNKEFLLGQSFSTPYHYGPIEEEAHILVPSLLELHERQIFTWACQPYSRTRMRGDGGKFYDHRQRPFVSFLVAEKNNPLGLFDELKGNKNIKVHARKSSLSDGAMNGSFTKKKTVTRYRRSFARRRWKDYTVIDPELIYQRRTFSVYQL